MATHSPLSALTGISVNQDLPSPTKPQDKCHGEAPVPSLIRLPSEVCLLFLTPPPAHVCFSSLSRFLLVLEPSVSLEQLPSTFIEHLVVF